MKTPRALLPEEISCRVQQVTENKGAIILLYKDARVDMNILDETYGPLNWKREHQTIDGNLYCTISVWDEAKGQWVSKQDVGVESYTEATKGEASDAFKRAGFNWAIGRELYTGPFIFVNLEEGEWRQGHNGKIQTTFKFGLSVKEITYTDKREIKTLVLVDKGGKERFTYGKGKYSRPEEPQKANEEPQKAEPDRKGRIQALCDHHKISLEAFAAILKELQNDGKVSRAHTSKMSDADFGVMLSLVHAALQETRQTE